LKKLLKKRNTNDIITTIGKFFLIYIFKRSGIMKKKKYDPAELEIIWFKMQDIITASDGGSVPDDDDENGGSGIGGGYNPDGWS